MTTYTTTTYTYTTDTIKSAWLMHLTDHTVSAAILYLQTLPPDALLQIDEEDLPRTWLTHRRPMTEAEIRDSQRRELKEKIVRERELIQRFSPPAEPERRAALLAQAKLNLERYKDALHKLTD